MGIIFLPQHRWSLPFTKPSDVGHLSSDFPMVPLHMQHLLERDEALVHLPGVLAATPKFGFSMDTAALGTWGWL